MQRCHIFPSNLLFISLLPRVVFHKNYFAFALTKEKLNKIPTKIAEIEKKMYLTTSQEHRKNKKKKTNCSELSAHAILVSLTTTNLTKNTEMKLIRLMRLLATSWVID